MEKTSKISSGQMFVVLFLARVMYMMLFKAARFDSGTPYMLTQLLTTLLECLAVLPAIMLFNAERSLKINENAAFSKAENALFGGYFLFISVSTLVRFAQFIHQGFSEVLKPWTVIFAISFAACYLAMGGIESLARVGTVVLWVFLALFLVLAVINDGQPDMLNLVPVTKDDLPTMVSYAVDELSSNWWLPMLVSLRPYLRKGMGKAAYGYLAAKFVMVELLILLITLVLWRYLAVASYPMLALGSYAKTEFIQHFGAINMLVWSLNCILVNGVYLFIASKSLVKKRRTAVLLAALVAIAATVFYELAIPFDNPVILAIKLSGIAVLGVLAPLVRLIILKIRGAKCAEF